MAGLVARYSAVKEPLAGALDHEDTCCNARPCDPTGYRRLRQEGRPVRLQPESTMRRVGIGAAVAAHLALAMELTLSTSE